MIVCCAGSAPSLLGYIERAQDKADVTIACGTAWTAVDADYVFIRPAHWFAGKNKVTLKNGRPAIIIPRWITKDCSATTRKMIKEIPDGNLQYFDADWRSFKGNSSRFTPPKFTIHESGCTALQWAVLTLKATEIHCVGMTGWRYEPGRFDGSFKCRADWQILASQTQHQLIRDVVKHATGTQFVFYGTMSWDPKGPNVRLVK